MHAEADEDWFVCISVKSLDINFIDGNILVGQPQIVNMVVAPELAVSFPNFGGLANNNNNNKKKKPELSR